MLRKRTAKTAFQLVVIRKEECVREDRKEREGEGEGERERETQCDSLVLGCATRYMTVSFTEMWGT